jgi:hypothetical protein
MKIFVITAAAMAISALSGFAAAKTAGLLSLPFGTVRSASLASSEDFRYTEAGRCIVRQEASERGEPLLKAVSECEKPIIMVFCILTAEDGWSCCSNAEYAGQPLMGHGDYHALSSRDLAESEPRNSFAVGCVPAKVGPAPRTLNPLRLGSVQDDPCYLAMHGLNRALLRSPQSDPNEILKALGVTTRDPATPINPVVR